MGNRIAGGMRVTAGKSTMFFPSKVVGVTKTNPDGTDRQEIVARCREGDRLLVSPEPDNPADPNALAVFTMSGEQVGYLPQDMAMILAKHIQEGRPIGVQIETVVGGTEDYPTRGLRVNVEL